jgi:hypothetical protein
MGEVGIHRNDVVAARCEEAFFQSTAVTRSLLHEHSRAGSFCHSGTRVFRRGNDDDNLMLVALGLENFAELG